MPASKTRRRSPARPPAAPTVADMILDVARQFSRARLYYGHGTDNGRDEAAALVFHCMDLDHADAARAYRRRVPLAVREQITTLARRRIRERRPLPYLLGEAWFAGLRFHVDERVLVPRSPFAELIAGRFEPWVDSRRVRSILEIGTGSGCIAVALARAFPASRVVATDISPDALEVARINVRRHRLGARIRLLRSDLYAAVRGRYDLIVSNPPYVPEGQLDRFPPEYRREPRLALASGRDGLETPAGILQHAGRYLRPGGWLALEVGAGQKRLERRFPGVSFLWPDFAAGGDGIALVAAADLPGA